MKTESIVLDSRGEILVIRIDRPPANAISIELARELEAAFDDGATRDARAIVLTGTGRFFSGGLDLSEVPAYGVDLQRAFLAIINRMAARLYSLPIPVVAAVNGHAVAGGFILILAADYRVGPTGTAAFGLTEARVGIPFPAVPMIVLRAELPPQSVRYATLYARNFGPDQALSRGVLDELVEPAAVLDRAVEVARDMAGMPADAYRRIKAQVRGDAIASMRDVIATGADPMLDAWVSPQAARASERVLARDDG